MAHMIEQNDSLFSGSGIRPWHGIGTIVEGTLTSADALHVAGLDWTVKQVPIYAGTKEVEGYLGNIRSDTKDCLGIITGKYKICQNSEAFAFVDDIMSQDETPCQYESAGSLNNGKRVWMLAKLPEHTLLGDKYERYLCFSNSHDGKSSIKVMTTNVRVVCNNTLTLATNSASRILSIRHMGSIEGKKREAMETLNFASEYIKAFDEKALEMTKTKFKIDKFLDEMFPVDEDASNCIKKRNESTREDILSIHNSKNDLSNFKNTAWGIYNAVSDWNSNAEPLRKTDTFAENRFINFMDGSSILEKSQLILSA